MNILQIKAITNTQVIQDIPSYEKTQETLALLKILALGNRQIEEGKTQPATDVFQCLRNRKQPSSV